MEEKGGMTEYSGTIEADDGRMARVTVALDPPVAGRRLAIPEGANVVEVEGTERRFPLSFVDPSGTRNSYPGERGPNELGLYTERYGPLTVTNEYGWEVQILSDGTVPLRGQVSGTRVPTGGGVLTGHDNGTPSSAAAFLKAIKPGERVVFKRLEVLPPTVPVGARSGAFPAWVVSGYWQQYQGPDLLTVLNQAPGYNVAWAAFATGGGGQNMTFSPRTYKAYSGTLGEDVFAEHVEAWQEQGKVVGLSFGGGVKREAVTVLRTDEEARRVFDRLVPIIDRYGFTAIDCDMENGPAGFTYEGLRGLFSRLRNKYGVKFGLCATPRPYEDFYYQLLGKLYAVDLLDLVQHQFYDALEHRDAAFLARRIPARVAVTQGYGVPTKIQVPGTIVWPGYSGGWNTTDNYLAATLSIEGIRGLMTWEFSLDQKIGWQFASKVAAARPAAGK